MFGAKKTVEVLFVIIKFFMHYFIMFCIRFYCGNLIKATRNRLYDFYTSSKISMLVRRYRDLCPMKQAVLSLARGGRTSLQ